MCHKVALEFFATNAPDPPHWTLNSCLLRFVSFGTVWLPYKTGAKRAELVQKFVPRSRVESFRNERTRSTQLDPKLWFWCIWDHLFALPISEQNEVDERSRSTPLDPKLMFCCISYYLGAFGTVWLPYETQCKTGRTSEKVGATKSRRNFFATNAPDRPHWTLNSCFVAFRTIWVHLEPFSCLTKLVQNGPN